eukprot:GFKZ01004684.1.p6 GENE.GFKZ01004684.1~~GFKZ01004684.1.p6  ORF type:complete len:108 (-),score=18.91 GFKZ01004684.1:500-823(-)
MGDAFHSLAHAEENVVLKQEVGSTESPRRIGWNGRGVVRQSGSKASVQQFEEDKNDHEAYDCEPNLRTEGGEKKGAVQALGSVVDMSDDANIVVEERGKEVHAAETL